MRARIVPIYTASELRNAFPAAFERARQRYAAEYAECHFWAQETVESLKATLAAFGVHRPDYSVAAWGHSWLRLGYHNSPTPDPYTLRSLNASGRKAFAVLESALEPFRIPWRGARRWTVSRYGAAYRAGMVPPCPFTGYCADDALLASVREDIRGGCTVADALRNLAHVAQRLLEADEIYATSADAFQDMAEAYGWEFTEGGDHG
jgi:hypothetical protein